MVLLAKIIVISRRLFSFLAKNLLFRPTRVVLRLFFHKVVVKLYSIQLSVMRRLGLKKNSNLSNGIVFDQKYVYVMVGLFTIVFVFVNLSGNSKAASLNDIGGKTILSTLIESEFGTAEEAQLVEETFDQEVTISPTQQSYLDNLSSARYQPIAEMNPQEEEEVIEDNFDDNYATVRPGMASNKTEQIRRETVTYVVEAGDTISTIAQKFGIGVNSILWENNLNAYSVIRPGDSLSILPVSGITYKVARGESLKSIAAKYDVSEEEILAYNDIGANGQLQIGQKLMIPGGKKDSYAENKPKTYSGLSLIKDLIKPSSKTPKPADSTPRVGNKMNWPTVGYRITQYFSWRHFGLDVANKIGTPLYAADAGVVEAAGWGNGYGNQILINHGGGKKTRYAHLSKFSVKKGDHVNKGQVVGLMGSTGWSTGSHIHFEVIINGVKYNPLNYVK